MFKKSWKVVRDFFSPEQTSLRNPWEVTMPALNKEQRDYQKSVLDTQALYLQQDIANKNLRAAHRNLVIAFLAVVVALLIGLAGIFLNLRQKVPTVIVNPPNVIVQTPSK